MLMSEGKARSVLTSAICRSIDFCKSPQAVTSRNRSTMAFT